MVIGQTGIETTKILFTELLTRPYECQGRQKIQNEYEFDFFYIRSAIKFTIYLSKSYLFDSKKSTRFVKINFNIEMRL